MYLKNFFVLTTLLLSLSCSRVGHSFEEADVIEDSFSSEGNVDSSEEEIKVPELDRKALLGVVQSNLHERTAEEIDEIVDNVSNSEIPLIRTDGVKGSGSIELTVEIMNKFAKKEIPTILVQTLSNKAFFSESYHTVSGPKWEVYEMSELDMDKFEHFINALIMRIASKTPKGSLYAFELFNEVNWADFNGDLQPNSLGHGVVYDKTTDLDDPSFKRIYRGIEKYRQCLKITRIALDKYFPQRHIKLITAGLVTGTRWDNHAGIPNGVTSFVTPEMFLMLVQGKQADQEDKTNYLQYADGIGIHIYPRKVDDMSSELNSYYFDPIVSTLSTEYKDLHFWITEWGYKRDSFEGLGIEDQRLHYNLKFIEALEEIGNTEVATLYDFNYSENYDIWDNGELLRSGTFFKDLYGN